MSKKATRYIVVLLAVMISFSAFSMAAFAETEGSNTSSADSENSSAASSQASSTGSSGQTGPVQHESDSNQVLVTFALNGGTGMKTSTTVTSGTKVSEFKTPTRKGYKFAGWEINGSRASGSMPINTATNLTATWTKNEAASSRPDSVDTKQQQIEAAASAADQATSDPGTLSSEDWNSLLNSSGSESSVVSSASSQTSSSAAAAGGFSTMLLIGVILVIIGVAGIGTFIYLLFIRGRGGKGGPRGPGGSGKATDDTIVFTDVNSYSDGKKHNSELFTAVRQPVPDGRTQRAAAPNPHAAQRPVRPAQSAGSARPKAAARQYTEKAQAKPVGTEKSDFDWEKFFNEEGRGE